MDTEMNTEIYGFLFERCVPYTLPAPWHRTPCDSSFVMLPEDRSGLLTELCDRFAVEELLDAGLIAVSEANEVAWHPLLTLIGEPIWVIGNHPNGVVVRAVIAGMRVLGREPSRALDAALVDSRQWQRTVSSVEIDEDEEDANRYLFVAYSMVDAAIMRSLGFRTVPGDAWRLSRSQLISLLRALDSPMEAVLTSAELESMGRREQDAEPRVLVFANWRLATLERQERAAALASLDHLKHLKSVLQLELGGLCLWSPSPQKSRTLGTQLEHLPPEHIPLCVMRTLQADPPVAPKPSAEEVTLERLKKIYPSPQMLLTQAGHIGRQLSVAEQRMQAIYDAQLAPVLREAAKASNLVMRSLWLDLAEIVRLKAVVRCRLTERIRQATISDGLGAGDSSMKDDQAGLAALFKAERALTQEIKSCREQLAKDQSTAEAAASKRRPSGASDLWTTRSSI